jgi:nitroreductase
MQRRIFLQGAAGVTVIVAGGAVWRAYDRGVFSVGDGPAFAPWHDWQQASGGPLGLVRAAILAASPHNTQPWLFKLTDRTVEVYIDPRRSPGALDPYRREAHIGIGCALENMMLAAAANGYTATATLLPGKLSEASANGEHELLAHVDLAAGHAQQNDLFYAIPHRHTNRNPYYVKPLPAEFLNEVRKLADGSADTKIFLFDGEGDRDRIVTIIDKANDIVYADPLVEQGSQRWIRTEWRDVQKFRDGLIMDEFGQPSMTTALLKFVPSSWDRYVFKNFGGVRYADVLRATPVFGVIAVRDRYDRVQCLDAGRVWQRAHLLATARHLAGRPVNEAVELIDQQRLHNQKADADAELAALIGGGDWQPTFMFRMGYPVRQVAPSPRRPAGDVLI